MPTGFFDADVKIPNLSGEKSNEQKFAEIENYLFLLLENLRYVLRNLSPAANFNEKEWNKIVAANDKALAKIKADVDENGASISILSRWKTEAAESLADIEEFVDDNGATVELIAAFYDKQNPQSNSAASIIVNATNAGSGVAIHADKINLGDSAYAYGSGKGLVVRKLFGDVMQYDGNEYPGIFYVQLDTAHPNGPTFELAVKAAAEMGLLPGSDVGQAVFSISFSREDTDVGIDAGNALNFIFMGKKYLGFQDSASTAWPKQTWDFSACAEVRGLGVVPVFG